LRRLLSRALNKNQRIILSHVDKGFLSLNAFSEFLSENCSMPKSTAKLNVKILCQLGLIKAESKFLTLTPLGRKLKELLDGEVNERF